MSTRKRPRTRTDQPCAPLRSNTLAAREIRPKIIFVNRELSKKIDLDQGDARIIETDGNWIHGNVHGSTDDTAFSRIPEHSGAVIVMTSGTMGPPKKILYAHRNIVLTVMAMAHLGSAEGPAALRSRDVMFDLIPLYHLFGWGSACIAPLLGTKIVIDGRLDPASVLKKIEQEKVTWFNCVPTMIHFHRRFPADRNRKDRQEGTEKHCPEDSRKDMNSRPLPGRRCVPPVTAAAFHDLKYPSGTVAFMQKVADGIYYLSTVGTPPTTSIYLLENDGEWAVFEPGPNSGASAITAAMSANGISPSEVKYLIVSHIHLDHAGASAALLDAYPESRLIVYKGAARHLADPSKLIASSSAILGPFFDAWGGLPSVPAGRITEATDGQVFNIGDMPLRIVYSPGHSPYHLSVWAEETGALFTGDAVGMYMRERNSLWPASPLPSFRLDMEMETLRRFESLGPDVLLIPHFEPVPDPEHFIGMNLETYSDWHELLGKLKESDDPGTAAETILRSMKNYEWARENRFDWHMFNMHVAGFLQYERTAGHPVV